MNQFKSQIAATLAALALAATSAPAAAGESLPTRAAVAIGYAIAAQGDAALEQIREEVQDNLLKLAPYLPQRSDAAVTPTAEAPDADKQ